MIQHLKKPGFTYFFIDELFWGPIPSSGSDQALGLSLVSYDCLYMISNHDIELVIR